MTVSINHLRDLDAWTFNTLIDARSPSEYAEDHLPGAINLPVLSDAERARVGTVYKQIDPFQARKIGAALVAKNVAAHLEGALADKPGGWKPLVYCWRGGQRSGSFATILEQIGWPVETLDGGYRSYRKLVVNAVYDATLPHRLILLDGNTGTAKTAFLLGLKDRGHQVLDLEGLAGHRGSLFGGLSQPQPSQKALDTALALAFAHFDPSRPVLTEAESSRIGERQLPPSVWAAMGRGPRIRLTAPSDARARFLVHAYRDLTEDIDALCAIIESMVGIHGPERIAVWQEMARTRDLEALALALITHHYDPRYAKWRLRHDDGAAQTVALDSLDSDHQERNLDRIEKAIAALSRAEPAAPVAAG
ncbi:MAG: tRNA 2-selenouridine(34) synthase MnmH [Alphaproteobacteria bacterium]